MAKSKHDAEIARLREDGWKSDESENPEKYGWWHPGMLGCVFGFGQAVIINNWRRKAVEEASK